jgi:hypothetical protein
MTPIKLLYGAAKLANPVYKIVITGILIYSLFKKPSKARPKELS